MSVSVEGNSEKISPQPKSTTPDIRTKAAGFDRVNSHSVIAAPSSANAITIVFSRPIRSDSQPKNGRVRPLVIRSSDSASGSSGSPNTMRFAMPKSRVNAAICEVTINPAVDIIVIMTNISQKIGVRSISSGR